MCEKMSVYAGEKRNQVNILRLCCGCGVCGVFACCGCGVCGVFAAVLPRQYLHSGVSCPACFSSWAGECVSFWPVAKMGVLYALSTLGHPSPLSR